MIGLDQTASVYTPNNDDGSHDVLAASGLACRLVAVPTHQAVGDVREELTPRERLLWGPDYTMPANAQVEVGGQRWNVVEGTADAVRGPGGGVMYRRCTITREPA